MLQSWYYGPLRPPKGALLYGPAGVGKSLLAAQIANDLRYFQGDTKVHVRLVQCANILSSTTVVGEAEKLLTNIFDEAEREAKSVGGGSLVILDDVHLICPRRGGMGGSGGLGVDQLAGTLLALLDGIGSSKTSADREEEASSGGLVVFAITTDPSLRTRWSYLRWECRRQERESCCSRCDQSSRCSRPGESDW